MKLVDLLARELETWPTNQACLWISDAHSAEVYGKTGSNEVRISGGWPCPEDYLTAIVYKADWQAAVEALKAASATKIHPLQQTLRDNGDLIAAQATIAQQAKMIEHLRGGPTPLYTAVDMATAAADGFRDGAASMAEQAYLAGWNASGEGWNGEHPENASDRETWKKDRDADIERLLAPTSKEG